MKNKLEQVHNLIHSKNAKIETSLSIMENQTSKINTYLPLFLEELETYFYNLMRYMHRFIPNFNFSSPLFTKFEHPHNE